MIYDFRNSTLPVTHKNKVMRAGGRAGGARVNKVMRAGGDRARVRAKEVNSKMEATFSVA